MSKKSPSKLPADSPLPAALVKEAPPASGTAHEAEALGWWAALVRLIPTFPRRERIEDIGRLIDLLLRLIFSGIFAYLAYWWLSRVGGIIDRQTEEKHLSDTVLVALLTTTTLNVLGLLYFVAGYLFPKLNTDGTDKLRPPAPPSL